jgi:hypothetical protein
MSTATPLLPLWALRGRYRVTFTLLPTHLLQSIFQLPLSPYKPDSFQALQQSVPLSNFIHLLAVMFFAFNSAVSLFNKETQ